jgi:hypothetical protein
MTATVSGLLNWSGSFMRLSLAEYRMNRSAWLKNSPFPIRV